MVKGMVLTIKRCVSGFLAVLSKSEKEEMKSSHSNTIFIFIHTRTNRQVYLSSSIFHWQVKYQRWVHRPSPLVAGGHVSEDCNTIGRKSVVFMNVPEKVELWLHPVLHRVQLNPNQAQREREEEVNGAEKKKDTKQSVSLDPRIQSDNPRRTNRLCPKEDRESSKCQLRPGSSAIAAEEEERKEEKKGKKKYVSHFSSQHGKGQPCFCYLSCLVTPFEVEGPVMKERGPE